MREKDASVVCIRDFTITIDQQLHAAHSQTNPDKCKPQRNKIKGGEEGLRKSATVAMHPPSYLRMNLNTKTVQWNGGCDAFYE